MKITDEMLRQAAPKAYDMWLATLPDDLPEYIFSARFEKKMEKLLRHPYRRTGVRTLLIAALVAALLTMTVGAELLPPVKTFRSGVVYVLSQVFPKSTDQIYTTDADHEGETRRPVLNWLPEGMIETRRSEQPEYTTLNFKAKDGGYVNVYIKRITEDSANTASIDTEDAEVQEILINGKLGTLVVEKNKTRLVFFTQNYRCSLSGILTAEEAIRIAENIILE